MEKYIYFNRENFITNVLQHSDKANKSIRERQKQYNLIPRIKLAEAPASVASIIIVTNKFHCCMQMRPIIQIHLQPLLLSLRRENKAENKR